MSRNFFGGGGLGGGKNPFSSKKGTNSSLFSRKRTKMSAQDLMDEKTQSFRRSHKDMVEDLMDEKMFNPTRNNFGFQLPGTSGGDDAPKFSKGYLAAMEAAKQKRMKEKARKREQAVRISPKSFNGEFGGRIDAKGRIMNGKGQILLTVNLETGIITDSMGMKVGKYSSAFNNDAKIEKLISKYSRKPGFGVGAGIGLFSGNKPE